MPPKNNFWADQWGKDDSEIKTQQEIEDDPDSQEIDAGLPDGWHKIDYSNGNVYEGDVVNQLMHGKGTYTYAGKVRIYEGEFKEHHFHGKGKMTNDDGSYYDGEWDMNKKHGQGVNVTANGDRFEGLFDQNQYVKGRYLYKDGRVYEGRFKSGIRHGKGKMKQVNGDFFEGEFDEGKMTGTFKVTYTSGKKYEGKLINSKKIRGKLTFADGSYYDGEFMADKPDGHGERKFKDGDHYVGEWREGQMDGKGKMKMASGKKYSSYDGSWKAGKFHGKGTVVLASGAKFEADWVHGTTTQQFEKGEITGGADAGGFHSPTGGSPTTLSPRGSPAKKSVAPPTEKPAPKPAAAASTPAATPKKAPAADAEPKKAAAPPPPGTTSKKSTHSDPQVKAAPGRGAPPPGSNFDEDPEELVLEESEQDNSSKAQATDLMGNSRKLLNQLRGSEREEAKSRIAAFYKQYNPEKLDHVEKALAYDMTEDQLMEMLRKKYIRPTIDAGMLDGMSDADESSDEEEQPQATRKPAPKPKSNAPPPKPKPAAQQPTSNTSNAPANNLPPPPTSRDMKKAAGNKPQEGFLGKYSLGKGFLPFGNWQRRYFILDDRGLCYYKCDFMKIDVRGGTTAPAGIAKVNNDGARLVTRPTPKTHKEVSLKERHLMFVVVYQSDETGTMKEYKLLCKADNEDDKVNWVQALSRKVDEVDAAQDFPES